MLPIWVLLAQKDDCVYELEEDLIVKQSIVAADDGKSMHIQLIYEGEGWLGFGFSPRGQMIGSTVVIGIPSDEQPHAGVYYLAGKNIDDVLPKEYTGEDDPTLDVIKTVDVPPDPVTKHPSQAPIIVATEAPSTNLTIEPADQTMSPLHSPSVGPTTATSSSGPITTNELLPIPAPNSPPPTRRPVLPPSSHPITDDDSWMEEWFGRQLLLPHVHGHRMLTTSQHVVTQNATHTVLNFVKHYDDDEGENDAVFDRFIYAVGRSNSLGYHRIRGMEYRNAICNNEDAALESSVKITEARRENDYSTASRTTFRPECLACMSMLLAMSLSFLPS